MLDDFTETLANFFFSISKIEIVVCFCLKLSAVSLFDHYLLLIILFTSIF